MSILIKGMEMPKTCEECTLESYCSLWVDARRMSDDGKKAKIRHPDCPLVEIPPHGRLIDADALTEKVIAKYIGHERKGKLVFAAAEIKQDIVDLISAAPPIIPAEEGE